MVEIFYDDNFQKKYSKIKDNSFKEQVKKQIQKISDNPEVGKPMRYKRKGTKEVYVGSYRLAYAYLPYEEKIIFLDIYHKDEQ